MKRYASLHRKPFPTVSFTTTATKVSLASPFNPTGFTACFWVYPTTLSSTKTLFSIDDGSTHQVDIETGTSPAVQVASEAGASGTLLNLAANIWSFLAITSAPSLTTGYGKATPQSAMVTASTATATAETTGTTIFLNGDGVGDSGIIAQYAGLKIWPFVMTESQLVQEATQLAPVNRGAWVYLPIRNIAQCFFDEASGKRWTSAGTLAFGLPTVILPVPEERNPRGREWVYVPSGQKALAAAIVGTSTVVAPTSVTRGGTLTIGASGKLTLAVSVTRGMIDSILGTSVLAFPLKVTRGLIDAILGGATIVAPLSVKKALTLPVHGATTVVDATSVTRGMADIIQGKSTIVDAVSVTRPLQDNILGEGSLTAFLGRNRPEALSVQGQATLTEAMGIGKQLATAIQGDASLVETLSVTRGLTATITALSALAATLKVTRGETLPVGARASLSLSLGVSRALAATILGEASLVEALSVLRALALVISAHGNLTADLGDGIVHLVMGVIAHANLADPLSVRRALQVAISGDASLTEVLDRLREFELTVSADADLDFSPGVNRALSLQVAAKATIQEQISVARALNLQISTETLLTLALEVAGALGELTLTLLDPSPVLELVLSKAQPLLNLDLLDPNPLLDLDLSPPASLLSLELLDPSPILSLTLTRNPMQPIYPGQSVHLVMFSRINGVLAAPGTVTMTLYPPFGAKDPPIVDSSPTLDATGTYHSDQIIPLNATPGNWTEDWTSTGSLPSQCGRMRQRLRVWPLNESPPS